MFGLYIHIPYCLQRCSYCDFATYVYDQILPPEEYVQLLLKDLEQKVSLAPQKELTSIYFGGGTPSLLSADLILTLLEGVAKSSLHFSDSTEITLEINPATLNTEKIRRLIAGGINRFSVGAQTFNDTLLKAAGRKHNRQDTLSTLELLQGEQVNYSFDLLFALPKQSLQDLDADLHLIEQLRPPHLSAYCLTVPTGHPMSHNRPTDDHQVEMFDRIAASLQTIGLSRYEISNFAAPGKESRHNLLYWQDQPYIGLGLSAHSYIKHKEPWGTRFWNPSSIEAYKDFILSPTDDSLNKLHQAKCAETLDETSSLFDFCHTALRLDDGLHTSKLEGKFSSTAVQKITMTLNKLESKQLIAPTKTGWQLTANGRVLSNLVFETLFNS